MRIHAERDSICMGDDCIAPNASELRCYPDDRLFVLMDALAGYVPELSNATWDVLCDGRLLDQLASRDKPS